MESLGATNCDQCTRNDVTALLNTVSGVEPALDQYNSCVNTAAQTLALNNAISAMNLLRSQINDLKFEAWNDAVGVGGLSCQYVPQHVCDHDLVRNCNYDDTNGCQAA